MSVFVIAGPGLNAFAMAVTTREWYSSLKPYSLGLLKPASCLVRWYFCWLTRSSHRLCREMVLQVTNRWNPPDKDNGLLWKVGNLRTSKEMLEKIAELDYSQSQLRDLNAQMRHWLDVADEDMAVLRSENVALRKQVQALEKIVNEAQQVEAEPCRALLTDVLDVKRCNEEKIKKLEEESTMMKEQNKKLITELKNLKQEQEQDKLSLTKFRAALIKFEFEMEEAQSGLQHRDEIIHKKNMQLKHSEETVGEYSIIIKDLKETNQELKKQLEDRQDETALSALNDLMEEKEGSPSPPLSFADELKLLVSSDEVKPSMPDSKHQSHEETETKELLKPQSLTKDLHTNRRLQEKTIFRRKVELSGVHSPPEFRYDRVRQTSVG
ncbi:golgin subfamily A member 6C-like isoform X1 [Lates japonicus]|uniref:Golgin subfamily A member 6C-like isoform X1 n=1 Tax=Lates japonicus TaxID=270547 RepID=A0AAD3RJJ4_LATJO|nr:golgin subfamily A member 6C-like isoform X1 [Lates japonicus]